MNVDVTMKWATTPPVDFPPLRDGINDRLPVMVSNYGYGCHGVFVCVYLVLRNLLPMGRVSRHCIGMIRVRFPWMSWNVRAFRLSR